MIKKISVRVFIVLIFSAFFAVTIFSKVIASENDAKEFHDTVAKIYNYSPCNLTEQEISVKSGELDNFWNLVGSNTSKYIPLLRGELNNFVGDGFFLYDGSMLLQKYSKTKEDINLVAESISKVNFCGLDNSEYFKTVRLLGIEGIDIWKDINHFLDNPQFNNIIIPQHALTLGKEYALISLIQVQDENFYADRLAKRLETEKDPATIRAILAALTYTFTNKGQEAINNFISKTENSELKKFAIDNCVLKKKFDIFGIRNYFFKKLMVYRKNIAMKPVSDENMNSVDRASAIMAFFYTGK